MFVPLWEHSVCWRVILALGFLTSLATALLAHGVVFVSSILSPSTSFHTCWSLKSVIAPACVTQPATCSPPSDARSIGIIPCFSFSLCKQEAPAPGIDSQAPEASAVPYFRTMVPAGLAFLQPACPPVAKTVLFLIRVMGGGSVTSLYFVLICDLVCLSY